MVSNGPVEVAPLGENKLAVLASEIDRYTMHDGLLAAAHRVQYTEAVISKDDVFADAGLLVVGERKVNTNQSSVYE